MDNLLTPEAMAAVLNTSPETVRRLSRKKQIPYIQLGKKGAYRYDRAAVLASLTSSPTNGLFEYERLAGLISTSVAHAVTSKSPLDGWVAVIGHLEHNARSSEGLLQQLIQGQVEKARELSKTPWASRIGGLS